MHIRNHNKGEESTVFSSSMLNKAMPLFKENVEIFCHECDSAKKGMFVRLEIKLNSLQLHCITKFINDKKQ